MAGPTAAIKARIEAILAGAYPASPSQPYIPAGVFSPLSVTIPAQNPRWPGGAARAAISRRWDLVWLGARWDGTAGEGASNGPWVRRLSFDLRVQYEIRLPDSLMPTDKSLSLGALSVASQRALDDLLEVQRVFMLIDAWVGSAIAYVPQDNSITIDPLSSDSVTAYGHLLGEILVQQDADSAATLWSGS